MGIDLKKIKEEIKNNSTNKSKVLFFKEDTEYRVRFLRDFEDGLEVLWHNDYEEKIDVPCREMLGRDCFYCDSETKRLSHYCWPVFEYESGEVKILKFPVNRCTPISAITAMYEEYGTLLDRDYKIKQLGKGTAKVFSVIPQAVKPFRNQKIKPLSDSAILKYLDKAFPGEDMEEEADEEEKRPPKRESSKGKGFMNEPETENGEWESDGEELDYNSMSPKELWQLCIERKIRCHKQKSKQYYIDLLLQYDAENEGWENLGEELPFN